MYGHCSTQVPTGGCTVLVYVLSIKANTSVDKKDSPMIYLGPVLDCNLIWGFWTQISGVMNSLFLQKISYETCCYLGGSEQEPFLIV